MPASHTIWQPSHPCKHRAYWALPKTAMLSLSCQTLVPGNLLYYKLTDHVKQLGDWGHSTHMRQLQNDFSGPLRSKTSMWHIGQIILGMQNGTTVPHTVFLHPWCQPRPLGLTMPRPARRRLNHLQTSVGCFRSSMHKWGMTPSVIYKCGVEGQTADHIMRRCHYSPPNSIHGLQVLDYDTIKWLLASCPNIYIAWMVLEDNFLLHKRLIMML